MAAHGYTGTLVLDVHAAKDIPRADITGSSDPVRVLSPP